jgi:hypothetical protein
LIAAMTIEATTQTTMTTCIQIQKRGMAFDPSDRTVTKPRRAGL